MIRGVVVPPLAWLEVNPDYGFKSRSGMSELEVNYFALYWDKIIVPDNNFISIALPKENDLIQSGLVERPEISFQGVVGSGELPRLLLLAQYRILQELRNKDKSTDWFYHQIGEELVLPQSTQVIMSSLRMELTDALPVPPPDANITDILEFKLRRKDELGELHDYIDSLYRRIINSGDVDFEKSQCYADLVRSIQNINRVHDELWSSPFKLSLKTSFEADLNSLAQGTLAMLAASSFSDALTGAAFGIGHGLLSSVHFKLERKSVMKAESNKLMYLVHAQRQGLLP